MKKRFLIILMVIMCIFLSTLVYASSWVEITSTGQVVDSITYRGITINAIYAPYTSIPNYKTNGTYCCAAFVHRFYSSIYGIQVSDLWGPSYTPKASSGSFSVTSSPKKGDIVRWNTGTHWAIVKEVNGNNITLIQQSSWDNERKKGKVGEVISATNSNYTFFRYSGYMDDKFFDFWGFDGGTITGTSQIWWKQTGYSNGGYTCDVNLDIDGNWFQTIYQDSNGYFSYYFDSTKYTNGSHTIGAIIRSTDGSEKYVTRTINISNDTEKPVISNIRVTNITNDGYTVWCDITDNNKIGLVDFPTWTENNGQDDLKSHIYSENVDANNARAWYRIKISEHNNEYGKYMTHIYAYDQSGNYSSVSILDWVSVNPYYDYIPSDIFEYNGNIYAQYDYAMSYASMVSLCEQAGGHIVTINDQAENDEIAKHITSGYYYIGYNNHTTNWNYGNSSYRNWGGNEPDNDMGIENCTVMTADGLWYDTKDEHYNYGILEQSGFILEIENSSLNLDSIDRFGKNKYEFYKNLMPYSVAKFYAESKGGHLVTIGSAEENELVRNNFSDWYMWTNLVKDGDYFLWDNGEIFGYENWNTDEPNNYQGIETKTVMESVSGKWNDTTDKFGAYYCIEYDNYYGDINSDGKIDDIDATLLLKHISDISKLNEEQLKHADVNNDNKIDLLDVIVIQQSKIS